MGKAGRRVQANARTLSYAVRQLFKPALREIQPDKSSSHDGVNNAIDGDGASTTNDTPEDQLIPTQPEAVPSTSQSEKSLGKRKRIEVIAGDIEEEEDGADISVKKSTQTKFTHKNIPPALKKYWHQRYRLFSRYDEGIQMDYDGWFSVTPENVAAQIAERCRCKTVVDAFCGVGGNAIQFAMTCEKVIAIDNSPIRLACARENAKIYGVEEYITFVQADYLEWAKAQADSTSPDKESIDVIFMSPPWGGISYQEDDDPNLTTKDPDQTLPYGDAAADAVNNHTYASYPLSRLLPKHGKELFDVSRKLTKNIAYYLPRNLDIHEAAALVDPSEKVEIEEEWMGSKLKALTLYYGDLAKNP